MANIQRIVSLLVMSCCLTGCGNLLRVGKLNAAKPQGIPFYVKTGACVQQTVYAIQYYRLTLKVSGAAGSIFSDTLNVSAAARAAADYQTLLAELEKPAPDSGSVLNAWKLLGQRQSFDPFTATSGQILLVNNGVPTNFVDYSTAYTLNQRKPFSGTASTDFKLASDGTLAEAQGETEDNTFATVVGALPLSDLIKSAAGVAAKAGAAAAGATEPVKFQLTEEERYLKTSLSKTTAFATICPVGTPLSLTDNAIAKQVNDVGASDASAGGASTTDKDTDSIAVSGTIKLPKATPGSTTSSSGAPPASGKATVPANGTPTSKKATKNKKQ